MLRCALRAAGGDGRDGGQRETPRRRRAVTERSGRAGDADLAAAGQRLAKESVKCASKRRSLRYLCKSLPIFALQLWQREAQYRTQTRSGYCLRKNSFPQFGIGRARC
jgi:hypothetical protein